jgi:phospholipid/cholesterol/gamma-HCH transport system substrate-binding protein
MTTDKEPGFTLLPKNLEFKVRLLLILTIATAIAFVLYVMYARGVFEAKQRLTLVVENAEGVSVGMDLTFSGFAIGRVQRIALAEDGKARIDIDVPRDDARWLRATSIFTLERTLVGTSKIRVFTANLQDPPLEDHAERPVLRGDATEELPRMIAALKNTLENIEQMTATGGSLQASLGNVRTLTERMAGRQGVLAGVLGSEDNAKKVVAAIDRANSLLASLGGVSTRLDSVLGRTDSMLGKTEQRVFDAGGVMDETQKAVAQATSILGDVRESLKKVDALLADAQVVGANAKAATTDLGALRAEVEASLRKVANLIDEINRKWPFERETGIKLP